MGSEGDAQDLLNCFDAIKMPFPGQELDGIIEEDILTVSLYLQVLAGYRRKKTAQCFQYKEWFHQNCLNIDVNVYKGRKASM